MFILSEEWNVVMFNSGQYCHGPRDTVPQWPEPATGPWQPLRD